LTNTLTSFTSTWKVVSCALTKGAQRIAVARAALCHPFRKEREKIGATGDVARADARPGVVNPKFAEEQPQIVRLRLPLNTRQTSLTMTVGF
jgi:hypothetical protein